MLDPISEMLTAIRNALKARRDELAVPFSKLKMAILKVLGENGFIDGFNEFSQGNRRYLKVVLKYREISRTEKAPAITQLVRVSREGRRAYAGKNEIKTVKSGYGIGIISTSRGVMTDKDARKAGVGGEYICEVW